MWWPEVRHCPYCGALLSSHSAVAETYRCDECVSEWQIELVDGPNRLRDEGM